MKAPSLPVPTSPRATSFRVRLGCCLLLAGWLGAATPVGSAVARGRFTIQMSLTASGSGASSGKDVQGGSFEMRDSFSVEAHSEVTYEISEENGSSVQGDGKGTASASVGGAGTSRVTSPDGPPGSASWSYRLGANFDPQQPLVGGSFERELGECGAGFSTPPVEWQVQPEDYSPDGLGRSAAGDAISDIPAFRLQVPTKQVAWSETRTQVGHANSELAVGGVRVSSSGQATCTMTFRYDPPAATIWEAVIIPPKGGSGTPPYSDWWPSATRDPRRAGSNILVTARIRAKPGSANTNDPPKARFTFLLKHTSQEPGICLNYPRDAKAARELPDLRFKELPGLELSDVMQRAETTELSVGAGVVIESFDFGAYAKLKVVARTERGETYVATVEGQPDQDFLTLPEDRNDNHVADSWEKSRNVAGGSGTAPDADTADQPSGQRKDGDGIGLYEKYRGFFFHGKLERLDPRRKHVFVYDPDGVVQACLQPGSPVTFTKASGCLVRFVEPDTWTGPGSQHAKRRVVNFNTSGYGHATDQHAVHVRANWDRPTDFPLNVLVRLGSQTQYTAADFNPGLEGVAFEDPPQGDGSPKDVWYIMIYAGHLDFLTRFHVRYHSADLPEFWNYPTDPAGRADWNRRMDEEVIRHIASHPGDYTEALRRRLARVVTHELGHALGIYDPAVHGLHPESCVMRYLLDLPRDPTDRFELRQRTWPSEFCRSAAGSFRGLSCQHEIKVTDR